MKQKPDTPLISPKEYAQLIKSRFDAEGDPVVAEGQMRYMRNRFAYYGLKAPHWVGILRELYTAHGMYTGPELQTFAALCFEDEYREMFYAGLQMIEKRIREQSEDFIEFLEGAIVIGDWWETVDWSSKLVGIHFMRFPAIQEKFARKWVGSGNIWLQRVAMTHQLLYRDKTNLSLLFEMILANANSSEFFIQKGAGWALRQLSKHQPAVVQDFILTHPELPSLTKREGMKWIDRQH